MRNNDYGVFALRYGRRPGPGSKQDLYLHYSAYGEPDEPQGLDYYFWLIRNNERTVLVDCGYNAERAKPRNRVHEVEPRELLSRMGVSPESVDHVVLSHLHYDHSGNIDLFPNATFTIARAELEHWTGPYASRPLNRFAVEQEEVAQVLELQAAGRLNMVEDGEQLFPGIRVDRLPGHTPGQLSTEIQTASGSVVLAADAAHFYDVIDLDRPFFALEDLSSYYRSVEVLRGKRAHPTTTVVPGHDPLTFELFEEVEANCVDLTQPRSGN